MLMFPVAKTTDIFGGGGTKWSPGQGKNNSMQWKLHSWKIPDQPVSAVNSKQEEDREWLLGVHDGSSENSVALHPKLNATSEETCSKAAWQRGGKPTCIALASFSPTAAPGGRRRYAAL
mmetsp:Transcript_35624/g.53594  ORF Transcript_35624/g.53594 Transcript_35624/m.53594 type:complete len:119 (+) Transcript_35624:25-381(+)